MAEGTILVVENDRVVSTLISDMLESEGFNILAADTVRIARELLRHALPAMVILDRRLPDADGLELCTEIRQTPQWKKLPVLILSALNSAADKIAGLKIGCDDYLGKPFSGGELLARVEALLRRVQTQEHPNVLEVEDLRLDMEARKAFLCTEEIVLWQKEFDLLAFLIQNKNRAVSRALLLERVWDYDQDNQPSSKIVDIMVSHLRRKLGRFGDKIVAVRGIGYRMDLP